MTKRMKNNLKTILLLMVTLVLVVLAVQTLWVGINFMFFRADIIDNPAAYNEICAERNTFYNSPNLFINWLSNMTNDFVRVPLMLLIITSPYLFVRLVRAYHISKRRKARV